MGKDCMFPQQSLWQFGESWLRCLQFPSICLCFPALPPGRSLEKLPGRRRNLIEKAEGTWSKDLGQSHRRLIPNLLRMIPPPPGSSATSLPVISCTASSYLPMSLYMFPLSILESTSDSPRNLDQQTLGITI
ncbi:hypothetical protein CRG98_015560 [Punica granatum]|uniref:Uncharacterized protein n=1 Tax=Punica granatum TaxID=22663 RepID=A0A2I0K666_PUNGR|nr:hypothetical protein CRG98_015560 [Punica granatum]